MRKWNFFPGTIIILGDSLSNVLQRDAGNPKNDWDTDPSKELQNETINTLNPKNAFKVLPISKFQPWQTIPKHAEPTLSLLNTWKGNHEKLAQVEPTLYYKWLYHHAFVWPMEDELGKNTFSTYLETFFNDSEHRWRFFLKRWAKKNPWGIKY